MRTVLLNAGPIAHMDDANNEGPIYPVGKAIVLNQGRIERIQDSQSAEDEFGVASVQRHGLATTQIIDLEGKAVVPGLIDAHTHLLWAGDRSREVGWRQEGLSYAQIANRGGGIRYTVEQTRAASDDALMKRGMVRLREALRTGTTHMEAKSGYGLDTPSELRLLEIGNRLGSRQDTPSLDLTWMGAHDIPGGHNASSYVEHLLSEQLPAVIDQGLARSSDVFCEPGWFSIEQSEDVLRASRTAGLSLRMHIDEFQDGGGAELAASLNVTTADHAYHTPMDMRSRMKEANVITGFLPGTPYAMGEPWPNMEEIVEHNIPFTLATDFNPNCRTLSLPFMCSLMVQRCGLHPYHALRAVTVEAAKSTPHPTEIQHGSIVEGGVANLNIVDGPNWELATLAPTGTPFAATVLNGKFISH